MHFARGTFGRAGMPIPQEFYDMRLYLIYLQTAVTFKYQGSR